MDFELSSEQEMLKSSVERFVQDNYGFAQRQEQAASQQGYSDENWATFAEMGWLSLPFAEASGGLGGSVTDMSVITGALGAAMATEPLVPTVLLGGRMVEILGSDAQRAAVVPAVAEGQLKLALAYSEPASGHDLSCVAASAAKTADGYVLSGRKSVVLHAASAARIIVIARTSGGTADKAGISAFLVEGDAPGLRRQDYPMVDAHRASDLWMENVPAELLGEEGAAFQALQAVIDAAICAVCAEAAGAMEAVLEMTKDYTGTRKQFGAAIGSNQVIQHRLVDMYTAVEEAKALTAMTAMRLDEGHEEASALVSAMKAKVGECARFVGAQGVQLHGGIGMTDEYPVGHYFKRLMAIDVLFGDAAHHLNRYADAI